MNDLKIKNQKVTALKASVDKMMVKEIREITAGVINFNHTAKNQSYIRWELGYIIFEVENLNEANNFASKIIKNVNGKIKKNLDVKLNLYSRIAANRVEDQNDYVMSQIAKISKLKAEQSISGAESITLDDYVNYLKVKLIGLDQEITVDSMKEFISELSEGASRTKKKEYLERLRKRYAIDGIGSDIQLNELIKRIKEFRSVEIVDDGYITSSKNVKGRMLPTLGIAALLGLIISLFFSYLYLTIPMKLIKKKLSFFLYQER